MKDPDFEGCKFIALPPDEERRKVKRKKKRKTFKLILAMASTVLVFGCITWIIKSKDNRNLQ